MIVLWFLTTVCYLGFLLAFRRPAVAAVATTVLAIAVWSAASALVVALISVIAWRLLRLARPTVSWRWDVIASAARTMSLVLLVVVMLAATPGIPSFSPAGATATHEPGPPIYVVLLDAYPRTDALAAVGFDNEPFLRELEDRGFDVISAANGLEALALLRSAEAAPFVILLDLMMPIMDGYGFLEEYARAPALATIPVLVVTAGHRVDRSRLGGAPIVPKPIDVPRLVNLLRDLRSAAGVS